VAGKLTPCPRPYCGGSILDGQCFLCGRSLTPPTVGTLYQRREHKERQRPVQRDPYLSLARRVLDIPERAPQWDAAQQAYVIDELD